MVRAAPMYRGCFHAVAFVWTVVHVGTADGPLRGAVEWKVAELALQLRRRIHPRVLNATIFSLRKKISAACKSRTSEPSITLEKSVETLSLSWTRAACNHETVNTLVEHVTAHWKPNSGFKSAGSKADQGRTSNFPRTVLATHHENQDSIIGVVKTVGGEMSVSMPRSAGRHRSCISACWPD